MAFSLSIALDSSGNFFVGGCTTGNGLDGINLSGTQDAFITKYNSSPVRQWTKLLGVSSATTFGQSVSTDSSGNVFVGGYTNGSVDGNTLAGTQDIVVAKYNSSGTKQWTRQQGVTSVTVFGVSTTSDTSDSLFIAGCTDGGLDGNALTGTSDAFVTKFNSAGAKQ